LPKVFIRKLRRKELGRNFGWKGIPKSPDPSIRNGRNLPIDKDLVLMIKELDEGAWFNLRPMKNKG
jgi:hypothetical protein